MHPCQQTVTGREMFVPCCSLFATVIFPPLGWVFSHLPRVALQPLLLGESCLVCVAACPRLVSFPNSFLGSLEMADNRESVVLSLTEHQVICTVCREWEITAFWGTQATRALEQLEEVFLYINYKSRSPMAINQPPSFTGMVSLGLNETRGS